MVKQTLKILRQILQDFQSVSDHFTTMWSKGLNYAFSLIEPRMGKSNTLKSKNSGVIERLSHGNWRYLNAFHMMY